MFVGLDMFLKRKSVIILYNRGKIKNMRVSLCVILSIILILPTSISGESILQNCKKNLDQHSYHMILNGSRIWKVVKFNFSEDTVLERHINFRVSMNGSSTNFIAEWFRGGPAAIFWTVWWSTIANPDRYFQYKIGPFYGYHSHTKNTFKYWGNGIPWTFGISMEKNYPQYYVFISYMNSSSYDIWLNWTGNATVSATQGTDVFAYDSHDFTGTLNIGRRRGTFILNGQKEITVENTLFAWYSVTNVSTGRETLQYTSPTGDKEYHSYVDRKGEHVAWNGSWGFTDNLWWGSSGTWKFSINMFNRGLKKKTPNIYLIGADVRLPD
jgi:hypothetical protein